MSADTEKFEVPDTLTDEEREALEMPFDEPTSEDEGGAGETDAPPANVEDDAPDVVPDSDKPADPEIEPPAAVVEPEEAKATAVVPAYKAELPADYDDRVKSLAEEEDALADKFKSGEIEFDEFRIKAADINARRFELSNAKLKAEIAGEMTEQTAQQAWQKAIDTMMARARKDDGIDYRKDPRKEKDLDMFVKALAADDENADKPMEWFLDEAHKLVKVKHGIAAKAVEQKDPPETPVRTPPKPNTTLAGVPGADGPGDIGDEFVDLDRLSGLELEDAISKLSASQREKYLKAV